jgi:hypothetical protein
MSSRLKIMPTSMPSGQTSILLLISSFHRLPRGEMTGLMIFMTKAGFAVVHRHFAYFAFFFIFSFC